VLPKTLFSLSAMLTQLISTIFVNHRKCQLLTYGHTEISHGTREKVELDTRKLSLVEKIYQDYKLLQRKMSQLTRPSLSVMIFQRLRQRWKMWNIHFHTHISSVDGRGRISL